MRVHYPSLAPYVERLVEVCGGAHEAALRLHLSDRQFFRLRFGDPPAPAELRSVSVYHADLVLTRMGTHLALVALDYLTGEQASALREQALGCAAA
jgi:hypothetical protein